MGRRNLRLGDYKATQAAAARATREKQASKRAKAADAPVKVAVPEDAAKPNPYERLMTRIDRDNRREVKSDDAADQH